MTATKKGISACELKRQLGYKRYKSESVNTLFQNNITSDSVAFTDQGNNYQDLHKFVDMHITEKSSKNTTKTTLKWAHIAISNAKRTFLGVYHKMSSDSPQNYLNEFVYKTESEKHRLFIRKSNHSCCFFLLVRKQNQFHKFPYAKLNIKGTIFQRESFLKEKHEKVRRN